MINFRLEYIWLDGAQPAQNIRGKTLVKQFDSFPSVEELPQWWFDGSSTQQADEKKSDCILKPVSIYPDKGRQNGAVVMCEVMMADGVSPHPTNHRSKIIDDQDTWFGFEQEYFLFQDGRPLGVIPGATPRPQGPYYSGVGFTNVGAIARGLVEEHLDICLAAGIGHQGINAETAIGQWEFQIFGRGGLEAADVTWVARYFLNRIAEKYSVTVEYHCKPIQDGHWNGSGMHANFSTRYMRDTGGKEYFERLMKAFEVSIDDHIAVYGPDNHLRLTGANETSSMRKFTYGVGDRGASIRASHKFVSDGYRGYLEDRRPNSQADPYLVASKILETISKA